jgi:hypothetical protein
MTHNTSPNSHPPEQARLSISERFHTWRFNAEWQGLLVFADIGGRVCVWTLDQAQEYARAVLSDARERLSRRKGDFR